MSKTALLRFGTEDEKREAQAAAKKRNRSLNSYVVGLIRQDKQKLRGADEQPEHEMAAVSQPPQTEAGRKC